MKMVLCPRSSISVFTSIAFLLLIILSFEVIHADSSTMEAVPGQAVGSEITIGSDTSDEIFIQPPTPIFGFTLDPTQPTSTRQETMVVDAKGSWQILVSADAATGGHMAEYDTATHQFVPGGKKLKTPMIISAENGNEVDLSKGGVLVKGSGKKVVLLTFIQGVTLDDDTLPNGDEYQIFLTFTGSSVKANRVP